jgi:uncharacterized membrane protein
MRFASLAIVLIAVVLSVVLYPQLPDPMPSHFNLAGEIDGWAPKPVGLFLLPLIMLGMVGLFAALPRISPRGYAVEENSRAYRAVELSTLAFMLCIHVMVLLMAMGTHLDVILIMTMLVGLLFVILGNYMSKMRRNFFIGIRTPWTLASEDVWFRTHRLGGRTFVIGGIALMVVPFAGLKAVAVAFPAIAIGAALVPVVYSYLIYRRLEQGR